MRKLFILSSVLWLVPIFLGIQPSQLAEAQPAPKVERKFKTGAKPSPKHKLHSTPRHVVSTTTPTQFAIVPKQLSAWLNDQYGDCVTAEEAFAKAAWSMQCGLPELFIPDTEVKAWASAGGFLNGAALTDVMDAMAKKGFLVNGVLYGDGSYSSVDFTTETVLQNAISQGPVKIGIDSNALPPEAGNSMGWYSIATGNFPNEDHCIPLAGYGTAAYLFQAMSVPLPAGLDGSTPGYLAFTWSTMGFVSHGWIMSCTYEAWARNPTTPGQTPTPTPPTPNPPTPNPPTPIPPTPLPPSPGTATITLSAALPAGSYTIVPAGSQVITSQTTLAELGKMLSGFAQNPTPTPFIPPSQPAVFPTSQGPIYYDSTTGAVCGPNGCSVPTTDSRFLFPGLHPFRRR